MHPFNCVFTQSSTTIYVYTSNIRKRRDSHHVFLYKPDRSDMRGRQAMERAEILRDFHPEDSGHGQGRCHEGASGGEDHGGCL